MRQIHKRANFETFPNSLLTIFRMATGESWNGIMKDCSIRPPDCDPYVQYLGGASHDVVNVRCGTTHWFCCARYRQLWIDICTSIFYFISITGTVHTVESFCGCFDPILRPPTGDHRSRMKIVCFSCIIYRS